MKIREARIDDTNKLIRLFQQLDSETEFMLFEPDERNINPGQQESIIQGIAQSASQSLLVACHANQIVGFIGGSGGCANRNRHSVHLTMGVLESHWGRHIGRDLLVAQEKWAKISNFHRLELSVMETNKRAQTLYKKFGFKQEGIRQHSLKVNSRYINEIWMAKLV